METGFRSIGACQSDTHNNAWTLFSWNRILKKFKAAEGHCQVPQHYIDPESGLKLGRWVVRNKWHSHWKNASNTRCRRKWMTYNIASPNFYDCEWYRIISRQICGNEPTFWRSNNAVICWLWDLSGKNDSRFSRGCVEYYLFFEERTVFVDERWVLIFFFPLYKFFAGYEAGTFEEIQGNSRSHFGQ